MTATTAQYYQCGPTLLQSNLGLVVQHSTTTLWTILAQFKDFQNKCLSLPNKHNIKAICLDEYKSSTLEWRNRHHPHPNNLILSFDIQMITIAGYRDTGVFINTTQIQKHLFNHLCSYSQKTMLNY